MRGNIKYQERAPAKLTTAIPMPESKNHRRRRLTRIGFVLVVALPLVLLLAWFAARPARPVDSVVQPLSAGLDSVKLPPAIPTRPDTRRVAAGAATNQTAAHRLRTQRVLQYGGGQGEVGMVRVPEMSPIGPEAFALARNGNLLVADLVNHRIQVYARDGAFLRSVDLPGVSLNDVMTDGQDRLYVYDQDRHTLLQFEANGTPQGTLSLRPADIDTRGYFHIAADAVYFANAAARDVLVAKLKDGILVPADPSAERFTDGIHAESGRVYSVAVAKGEALRLQIRDPAAPAAPQNIAVALPDIVSACYVGEDQSRGSYVQIERLVGGRVALEVLTFNRAGEQLSVVRLPENDYALWTTRLLDVAGDGTIVQFLPQKDQVRLNLFSE